jgi:dTDP-4-dehydrorhamnose reductase
MKPLRILLLGKTGQVGWELARTLSALGSVLTAGRGEADLAHPAQLERVVREAMPDVLVNAAAYTAVDQAEVEPELAMRINCEAQGILAAACKKVDSAYITYSTDYVFDGTAPRPYQEEDATAPINVYGRSKVEGERAVAESGAAHLIFRTSWVYGSRGKNFLRTIIRLGCTQPELRVVDDQIGAPTWSRMIAEATALVLAQVRPKESGDWGALRERGGVYHLTASGETSWCRFARAILERTPGVSAKVVAVSTSEYPTRARRPARSVLCCDRLRREFDIALPDWEHSLDLVMAEMNWAEELAPARPAAAAPSEAATKP